MYNPAAYLPNQSTYNFGDPVGSILRGYQAAKVPEQMRQEQQIQALRQAQLEQQNKNQPQMDAERLKALQMQNQYYPQQQQSELALQKAQAQRASQNDSIDSSFTGDIGNAVNIEKLAAQYGEDNPMVKAARAEQQRAIDYQKSLQGYRSSLADTAPKRASTTLGKTEQELDDIKAGFAPGTNRSQSISPEQQQQLVGQYNLQIQKNTTDSAARAKTLNATNIDKTLEAINPESLLQYSGATGALEKASDSAMAPFTQSKKYTDYTKSKAAADMLATQVRQFYGDSIQPSMIARLETLTNPESFGVTPKQARENYDQITSILRNETQTYRDALKGTNAYEGQSQGQQQSQPSQEETVVITDPNGNPRRIPKSQEAAALADLARRKANG